MFTVWRWMAKFCRQTGRKGPSSRQFGLGRALRHLRRHRDRQHDLLAPVGMAEAARALQPALPVARGIMCTTVISSAILPSPSIAPVELARARPIPVYVRQVPPHRQGTARRYLRSATWRRRVASWGPILRAPRSRHGYCPRWRHDPDHRRDIGGERASAQRLHDHAQRRCGLVRLDLEGRWDRLPKSASCNPNSIGDRC